MHVVDMDACRGPAWGHVYMYACRGYVGDMYALWDMYALKKREQYAYRGQKEETERGYLGTLVWGLLCHVSAIPNPQGSLWRRTLCRFLTCQLRYLY